MKKSNVISAILVLVLSFFMFSCEDNFEKNQEQSILPQSFKVDIPDAISHNSSAAKNYAVRSATVDTLQGNNIYEHLNTFIWIGEEAAEIVEGIILTISVYGINKPMSLSYTSDEDARVKNLVVKDEVLFETILWDHELTITDAMSESNSDGGVAIQVFWDENRGDGIKGVAILKPYNINRDDELDSGDAIFRIDYSELGENGYDAQMIVQIVGLPVEDPLVNPYSVSALKMFAGKKGDIVDVFGNTNHPNAKFFNGDVGFNWAFVASGDENTDVAVAEVGLPPSTLDATSRTVLLEQYSIKQVFTNQIYSVWPTIDKETVDAYLFNTGAPGFFNTDGFIQGEVSPGSEFDEVEGRILELTPYNPKEISELSISFK